ncbi:MAG: endonuclease, partial [Nitrospirae bacterium]
MIRLGVHTSISGGLWKAIGRADALGCNTLQMFCHSPRTWQMHRHSDEDIKIFKEQFRKSDIAPVFIHCSYLINLCSPDRAVRSRSVRMLAYELETLERLNAHYLVLHPGRAVGQP